MLGRLPASRRRRSVAGDKGYDTRDFVARTPPTWVHPPRRAEHHQPALGDRWAHHPPPGPRRQPAAPETDEEPIGWVKTIAGACELRYIGQPRNPAWFRITTAVYNIVRITALDATAA